MFAGWGRRSLRPVNVTGGPGGALGTVRGHVTDPLPFLAGRGLGRAERFRPRRSFNPLPRRIPSASREARAARQGKSLRPRKYGPERKTADWSAAKRASRKGGQRRPDCAQRRSGPSLRAWHLCHSRKTNPPDAGCCGRGDKSVWKIKSRAFRPAFPYPDSRAVTCSCSRRTRNCSWSDEACPRGTRSHRPCPSD